MPYEVFTLSHEPDKDDPEYFKKLLQHYSLQQQDVIYFEHGKGAVDSAKSVGIKSYHYDEDKKDLGSLKSFLEENA